MYQQILLLGNLGGDPSMRFTQDGTPVTSFRVATKSPLEGPGWDDAGEDIPF